VQALLQPGGALLAYALSDASGSYVWVIARDRADFLKIPLTLKNVAAQVAALRGQMERDGSGKTPKVDLDLLHALYQDLIAPALPSLAGVKHLMLVPTGPLTSLPFGLLVASPPWRSPRTCWAATRPTLGRARPKRTARRCWR